jgi:AraC-like DNA-binding protein
MDVSCRDAPVRGDTSESTSAHTVVFVRRGLFTHVVDGVSSVCDPTVAYCTNPGDEERFDHPHRRGDSCTAITLDQPVAAWLLDAEERLPADPLVTSPDIDLAHRLLLAAVRRRADEDELVERALGIAVRALEPTELMHAKAGRPTTALARKRAVSGALEALAAEPGLSLVQLACALAVSPHHLSRIFRRATGHTISRHRIRLRTRAVLERFADGESDLARVAADVGFADQSHLCRVMQAEVRVVPSSLRDQLRA